MSFSKIKKEQKYFIGYAGYYFGGYDLFGEIIHIDEEITSELLEKMNDYLLYKLIENTDNKPYDNVQIFNLVKLN